MAPILGDTEISVIQLDPDDTGVFVSDEVSTTAEDVKHVFIGRSASAQVDWLPVGMPRSWLCRDVGSHSPHRKAERLLTHAWNGNARMNHGSILGAQILILQNFLGIHIRKVLISPCFHFAESPQRTISTAILLIQSNRAFPHVMNATQYGGQPQPLPGYATTPNLPYGQQPLAPRLLHIYIEGYSGRHVRILDSDKQTLLYHIDINSGGLFSSKPHVKVTAAATGTQVGTATFHSLSSNIDLTVHNQPIVFSRPGVMSSSHEFQSRIMGGSLKWKKDGWASSNLQCVDEREQVFAKFQRPGWAKRKLGKFELGPSVSGVLMDEIVISGIAMLEWRRRQQRSSSSATAGGAAGGAAGAAC